jgi:hypothetical protein
MIHGLAMSRLLLETASFLSEKGVFEELEKISFLRLYGFQGKPFLLPFYISDRIFIIEVCRQYKYWTHFFNEKRKNQFIPTTMEIWRGVCKTYLSFT